MSLKDLNDQLILLEDYSKFLEEQGYIDTDWRQEQPTAIDEFMRLRRNVTKEEPDFTNMMDYGNTQNN